MNSKPQIMIVDDTPVDIRMLLTELSGEYSVTAATSAEKALQLLADEQKPDLILLDINMPGMSGYDACRLIRAEEKLDDIDVIFISANDSTEEILKGFEAGAIDYIVKPYDPDMLQTKIKTALNLRAKRKELVSLVAEAQKITHTFMDESGALGVIIDYFRNSHTASEPEQLLKALLSALGNKMLNATVYVNDSHQEYIRTNGVKTSTLEEELLRRLYGYTSPFLDKGNKLFVIRSGMVLLIKNMPMDETKRGSVKDTCGMLLDSASAKWQELRTRRQTNLRPFHDENGGNSSLHETLDALGNQQKMLHHQMREIVENLNITLESTLPSLDLTYKQEESLQLLLSNTNAAWYEQMEQAIDIEQKIRQACFRCS